MKSAEDATQVQETVARLRTLIPASTARAGRVCIHHPDRPAEAVCPVCTGLVCRSCALLDAETLSVCCPLCRAQPVSGRWRRVAIGLACTPASYVVLVCLVALVACFLGLGNPSLADLTRRDAGKEWFRQKAGRLWLAQAERTRARARRLAHKGASREAQAWATLSADAFGKAADVWAGAPVAGDMRIGQGLMLMLAGRSEDAWDTVQRLEPPDDADSSERLSYRLQKGRIALAAGRTALGAADVQGVLDHLAQARASARNGIGMDFVDKIVAVYAKDRRVALIRTLAGRISETALTDEELRLGAMDALRQHGLPVPEEELSEDPLDAAPPTPAPSPPRKPKGPIVIKQLQDR